jgi:hypothetical protein
VFDGGKLWPVITGQRRQRGRGVQPLSHGAGGGGLAERLDGGWDGPADRGSPISIALADDRGDLAVARHRC